MKFEEFMELIEEHSKTEKGFQIALNSGCLEEKARFNQSVGFMDIYFTKGRLIANDTVLVFENSNATPVYYSKNGEPIYPLSSNNTLFIQVAEIEDIEDVQDYEDWFELPSTRLFNVYMFPENDNRDGSRNVITVGFME